MKQTLLSLLLLCFALGQSWASKTFKTSAITELFFSEYIEGSGNNKALEIYNGTGTPIDLAAGNYSIELYSNGADLSGAATQTLSLTGTIADGNVFVIANSSANAAILAQADATSNVTFFNGDDAIVLKKNGVIIDLIGTDPNADPGSEWGTGDASTQNNTIRRKTSVMQGDADGFDNPADISSEWEGFPQNNTDDLGLPATIPAPNFIINEVDADTQGTDVAEFVEIYDGGLGNQPLDGLTIVLFNGSDDRSYNDAFDLDGLRTDANGYFLLANAGVADMATRITTGTGLVIVSNGIQNGADAVALYQDDAVNFPNDTPISSGSTLIDAMVYDTNDGDDAALLQLLNTGQAQLNEAENGNSAGDSNQRIPNGSGGARNTTTYVAASPTPGTENITISTIADARAATAGDVLTIEGTLTVAGQLGTTAYIQDATGGIALYNGGGFDWSVYSIGDKLRIKGERSAFNNQIQLKNLTITDLSSSSTPTPTTITLDQLDAHRGKLVTVQDVHFPNPNAPLSSGNYTLTSGAHTGTMRIDGNVTAFNGKTQPNLCTVTGVVGYYQTAPQLMVRITNDIPCVITITPPTPTGTAPTQLLITEIVTRNTDQEFIEIFNPTTATIDLSDVYLTDATFSRGGVFYYNLPTGSNAGGGGFGDFHARFPAGASIGAGEYQTVALNGAGDFNTAYGQNPTYELYENGANPVTDMREAFTGSINGQGGLSGGEVAILYYWDGSSDLVTDLDYILWGDKAEAVDKTGVSIDGNDGDATATAYKNDVATGTQEVVSTTEHDAGKSFQRIDLSEGTETKTGGNGGSGHNEMSENLSLTWRSNVEPSPNAAYSPPFVINEIDSDVSGTENTEFIEIYDGGLGNQSLDGLTVVLFNGSDDKSYTPTFDLDGYKTDANGYFLIVSTGTIVADWASRITAKTAFDANKTSFLQNGADAVALYLDDAANFPNDTPITTTNLLDAIVYDTNDGDDATLLSLLNATEPQKNEDENGDKDNHSLQRIPNGAGGKRNTSSYQALAPTPGTANFIISTIAAARAAAEGDELTIEGALTVTRQLGSSAYIQDATGGIALYNGGGFDWSAYTMGDQLRITGERAAFNDQIQLKNLTITNLSTNAPIVPATISIDQLNAFRGQLVTVQGVHFPNPNDLMWGGNYTLTSGANTGTMRIDGNVTAFHGKAQPNLCDVTGVVGYYRTAPQLLVRLSNDLPCANTYTPIAGTTIPHTSGETLDIVSWNIEHFGNTGTGPTDEDLQEANVINVINTLGADIVALQEITDENIFATDVLPNLNGYAMAVSPFVSGGGGTNTQNLVFLYNTSTVTLITTGGLLTNAIGNGDVTDANYPTGSAGQFWSSGRFPFLMEAEVNLNGTKERVALINIHGKAFGDNANFKRRKFDAEALYDSLQNYLPNHKIVILGDYNDDVDASTSVGDPSPYKVFVDDANSFKVVTKTLSDKGQRSTVGFDNVIDHLTISNELFDAYITDSEQVHYEFYLADANYGEETSDHFPVSARFRFPEFVLGAGTTTEISKGNTYNLGATLESRKIKRTFTITNNGIADLRINDLVLDGNAKFSITSSSITSGMLLAANASIDFEVSFESAAVGNFYTTLRIPNNDGDESKFQVRLKAKVLSNTGGGEEDTPETLNSPSNLAGTATSDTSIHLTWTDNSDNETGFHIYQNSHVIATINADSTEFTVTGLSPNTAYNFRVEAFKNNLTARTGTLNITTLPAVPTVSWVSDVCGTGQGIIQLSGAPNGGSYRLYAEELTSGSFAESTSGRFQTESISETTTFYATVIKNGRESTPRIAVQVAVKEQVTAEVLEGSDLRYCEERATLHALEQENASYVWKRGNTVVSESITAELTDSGTYTLTVSRDGCSASTSVVVELAYKPTVGIAEGANIVACETTTLTAVHLPENASCEWLKEGIFLSSATQITVSETANYQLRVTENGCTAETSTAVTIYTLPAAQEITATATTFCPDETVTLTVPELENVNYQWYRNGRLFGNNKTNTLTVGFPGAYSVRMSIEGVACEVFSQEISLEEIEVEAVTLEREDETLILSISADYDLIEWFDADGHLPAFDNQTSISPENGVYWAKVSYPTGCSSNSNAIRFYPAANGGGAGQGDGLPTGLEDEKDAQGLEIFPNPSNGIFFVKIAKNLRQNASLTVLDALGRALQNLQTEQQNEALKVDLTSYAAGVYYFQISTEKGIFTQKIIKE